MRIAILTIGTRGDVEPFIALGMGLKASGHDVRVITTRDYESFVTGHDLTFCPVEADIRALMGNETGQEFVESGRNPIQFMRKGLKLLGPLMARTFIDAWDACRGADAIICALMGIPGFYIAAELDIPCFEVQLQPSRRTRAFPAPGLPNLRLGILNLLSHVTMEQALWLSFRPAAARWYRKTFPGRTQNTSWPTHRPLRLPALFAYSSLVVPKPPDWPESIHVTGFWFLDNSGNRTDSSMISPELVRFLEAGSPPVFIGFGSMGSRDPGSTTEMVLTALRQTRQRGILLTGWGGLGNSISDSRLARDDRIFVIHECPFDWLFPRMAAVIHHGGVGTFAQGIRAGVPSIITPVFADQFLWGQRVFELGAGAKPIPRQRLTADRLAEAIHTVITDPSIGKQAAALGVKIRAESGIANAVEIINHVLSDSAEK